MTVRGSDVAAERLNRSLLLPGLAGAVIVGAVGIAAFELLPAPDIADFPARLFMALAWTGVAALFGPMMAVEAVAHERLQSDAFDPLAGHQTRRLQVNLRYLQSTLEQFILFAAGLLSLAALDVPGGQASTKLSGALTLAWLVARYLFWAGYHRSAGMRVLGIIGLFLPLAMLAVASTLFADRLGGHVVAAAVVALLVALEAFLFRVTRDKPPVH